MDNQIIQTPMNTALVSVADLIKSHDLAFKQGHSKGVFIGVVGTLAVVYVYKQLNKNRPSLFNLNKEKK